MKQSYLNLLWQIKEKSGYSQLGARQRLFVKTGLVFLAVFLIFQIGVSPYFVARQRLVRSIAEKKNELTQLIALQKQYRGLSKRGEGINKRLEGSLFSFVEEQAVRADIKKHILSMRPSTIDTGNNVHESSVEIKLGKISLGRLVAFLKLIENSKTMVFVPTISIQDSGSDNVVNVIMQVATLVNE